MPSQRIRAAVDETRTEVAKARRNAQALGTQQKALDPATFVCIMMHLMFC